MKSVISCTADEKYSYFIPIVTWAWNRLGVGVILFLPESSKRDKKIQLGLNCMNYGYKENHHYYFDMPKHKEATAAQCVRLYGACLDLPEDEVLITSDIDMAVFKVPEIKGGGFSVVGTDLVPEKQLPICYISATVGTWRDYFNLKSKTYQQCLDSLLGKIECESFRGNYWGKDQEEAFLRISGEGDLYKKSIERKFYHPINRSNGQNQFAQNRYDRDDQFILDRLSPDTIDFHMPRPGYEDKNFQIILTILKYHYPDENFDWLISYTNDYKKIL